MSTYFTPPSVVVDGTTAQASDVNDLSVATAAAFDTLAGTGISGPAITAGDAYKVPQVNTGETSLEYVNGLRVDIDAADGTQVLSNGTDGTDATFLGDVTGDVTGSSGSCTGNSATATLATNATDAATAATVTTVDESADTACYLGYFNAATGDQAVKTGTNLTFNSSTGDLGSTSYTSSVATGTPPFTIASTTEVTNLNVEFLGGVASSGYATYSTGTTAIGGDLTGDFYYSKCGNVVTLWWPSATHASGSSLQSAVGIVPSGYRPSQTTQNVYLFNNVRVNDVTVSSAGTFTFNYRDWAGAGSATTLTNAGSISYIIP